MTALGIILDQNIPVKRGKNSKLPHTIWLLGCIAGLLFLPASIVPISQERLPHTGPLTVPENCSSPVDKAWIAKVDRIKWVAYSAPNPNTEKGFFQPTKEVILQNLLALKKAGFTGLITYGSVGIMGREFPEMARSLGFNGIIMGIWNPKGGSELQNAINASALPIVLGYGIGNEGLSEANARYSVDDLCSAITAIHTGTGKPAATSEDIEAYYRQPELLSVGDWVFPISHPYWHFTKYPLDAIQWEKIQYASLLKQTDRYIFFKEVGLPTDGAFGLSETNQDIFYRGLAKTDVHFAYFEGFDQPSKNYAAVEPHWGLFHSNQSPKLLALNLMGYRSIGSTGAYDGWMLECTRSSGTGCSTNTAGETISVGRDAQGRLYRAMLSFNAAPLPDHAIISSVSIKVRSAGVVGSDPFIEFQGLKLDVCASNFALDQHLRPADFQAASICHEAGSFEDSPDHGWYLADLPREAFRYINSGGTTRFRLRFGNTLSSIMGTSYIEFYSGDAIDIYRPLLVVSYSVP